MAAYRRVDDLTVTCRLTALHRDQLRAQCSVSSMGSLYLYLFRIWFEIHWFRCLASLQTVSGQFCSHVLDLVLALVTFCLFGARLDAFLSL